MKDNAMSKAQTDVVAALRIELDATKAALAKADALDLSRAEEIQRLNTMLGDTAAQRDEARAERDALTKQVEAERHLHDALGSTLRIRSLESERDALTKQVEEAWKAAKATFMTIETERDSLREQVRIFTSSALCSWCGTPCRAPDEILEHIKTCAARKDATETENNSLRKQVSDLKARLKAAAGCIQRDELGSQVNWPDRLDAALNLKLKSWRKGGK